jgi:hypothetical protein
MRESPGFSGRIPIIKGQSFANSMSSGGLRARNPPARRLAYRLREQGYADAAAHQFSVAQKTNAVPTFRHQSGSRR